MIAGLWEPWDAVTGHTQNTIKNENEWEWIGILFEINLFKDFDTQSKAQACSHCLKIDKTSSKQVWQYMSPSVLFKRKNISRAHT